jgi:hypothetical protein
MNTPNLVSSTNFKLIKDAVARGLWVSIKYAKGSCVYLSPSKVLRYAKSPEVSNPVVRRLVRYVMDELVKYGYMEFMYRTTKRELIYCVHRNSPLWELIVQSGGPEDVLSFLEKVVP